jgi:dipeptidyl aminopeptidase/acylaminoacyl peptidase
VLFRDLENEPWRMLMNVLFGEEAEPVAFGPDDATLYLLSDVNVNTQRLYAVDLRRAAAVATDQDGAGDGTIFEAFTLLAAREDVDVGGLIIHPTRHTVQAVGYDRGRLEWVALDPDIAPDLDALRAGADGDFVITSRSRDDRAWLVAYTRDNGSAAYYVYDREGRRLSFLFSARPALDDATLARTTPVEITARDGLTLPSYLTLPPTIAAAVLPLVLHVHGGPWARDRWGFSPTGQWLANRGYAVLQVNYRGSTGFGKAFTNAGNREWAARMHEDLVDAVRWAIEAGYADPNRVAIMGGSYGGYAALVGLTFTPELFVCGVDVVGPSNLQTLLDSIPPYWEPLKAQFIRRVGDPDDPAFLRSRSPLFFADRIVRPLLIAQGANDPRVKQAESDQIVQAMRARGQQVTYLLFADEGHGFARPENQRKFAAAAEKFLANHLGGRCEPARPGEEPPLVPA